MSIPRSQSEDLNALRSGSVALERSVLAAESAMLDQKRTALEELRDAMEKRDKATAAASRFADEEAQLEEEIQAAAQEKEATLAEAQAQFAVLESARVHLENLQASFSAEIEEARRNLNAAKTASDTAAREARVAADGLARLEERLSEVRKQRGEMRWQQATDHEAFEKVARTLRIFTQEALDEAFEEMEKARAAYEKRVKAMQGAESQRHGVPASEDEAGPTTT